MKKAVELAERAVLSAWLYKPETIHKTPLVPEHFFHPKHAAIASAIVAVSNRGQDPDPVSVSIWLEEHGSSVGPSDLTSLQENGATTAAAIQSWSEKIIDQYELTKLAEVMENARRQIERGNSSREVLSNLNESLERLPVSFGGETTLRDELVSEVRRIGDDIQALARGESISIGLSVGLGIDRVVHGGLPLSTVCVLAGDTGSGKSSVMQCMLDAFTASGEGCAMVFSAEDSLEMYRQRALSRYSGVPLKDILRRTISPDQHRRIIQLSPKLARNAERVILDEAAGLSPEEIIQRYRRVKAANPDLKLVCVDYLQILAGTEKDERMSIRNAMLRFQHAAKQDGITILALSQLNREHAKRVSDPRPRRHDLYGSGAIEQYSKCIMGVYRPALFMPEPVLGRHYFEGQKAPRGDEWQCYTELWILKNVRGPMEACLRLRGNVSTGNIIEWIPEMEDGES